MMKKAIQMRSKGRRPALFAVFASLLFAALLAPVGLSAASATTPTPGPDNTDYLDSHQITPADLGLPADSTTPMSGKVDVSHLWSLPTGSVFADYADVQTAGGKFSIQSDVQPSVTFNVKGKVEVTHGKGLPGLVKDGIKSLDLVPYTYTGTDPMSEGIERVADGTTSPYVWNSTSEFISHTEHFRWTSMAPSRGVSVWSTFIDGSSWTLAFAPVDTEGGNGGDVDGSITGNVAKDGAGISGVKADLFRQNADGTRGEWVESAHTDADGNVVFDDVAPGCYVVTYTAPSGETFADGSRWLNQSICVDDNEDASLPAVDLAGSTGGDEGSISGTVDRDGSGVAGVKADLYTANEDGTRGTWLGSRTTDDDGDYTFGDVAAGCYIVTFTAAADETFVNGSRWTNEQVCVETDEDISGVDATLAGGTIDTAGTISGSTEKDGAAAPGVKVDLYVANADGSRGTWLGSELTDDNGEFSFDPVNPGCYVLTYTAPVGETFANGSRWMNQAVCVGDNEDVQLPTVDVQGSGNAAPTVADIADQDTQQGDPVSIQVQASDPDGDTLTYTATGLPAGVSIDPATGVISGTPTEVGNNTVTVTATDPSGASDDTSFDWAVQGPDNAAPTVADIADQDTQQGDPVSIQVQASDPDGDTLTYTATGLPAGVSIDPATGVISGTPTEVGNNTVTVTATDPSGASDDTSFDWAVQGPDNAAPTIADIADQDTQQGDPVSIQVQASDPDGDTLTYTATGLPAGVSIDPATGVISGTPTEVGNNTVTVTATDPSGASDDTSFDWAVQGPDNAAPTIADIADQDTQQGDPVSIQVQASDPDGDTLTYRANGLPAGVSIDPATGLISGTPTESGTFNVRVRAIDPSGERAVTNFDWVVQAPDNGAPTIADIADQDTQQGDPVSIQAQASDPDGDTLTYTATGLPAGVSIDPATGLISGTPTESGTFNVRVRATDPSGDRAVTDFSWTVRASCTPQAGQLPLISITPALLGLPATTSHAKSGSVDLSSQWDLSAGSVVLKYYYVKTSNGKFVFNGLSSKSIFKLHGSKMTFAVTHDASIGALKKEGVSTLDFTGLNYTGANVSYPLYSHGAGSSYAYVYNKSWHDSTNGGAFQWTTAKPSYGVTVFGLAPHGGSAFYSIDAAPHGTVCS